MNHMGVQVGDAPFSPTATFTDTGQQQHLRNADISTSCWIPKVFLLERTQNTDRNLDHTKCLTTLFLEHF